MKYGKQYIGKWVVSRNDKIIASDASFDKLQIKLKLKVKDYKNSRTLMYSFVPRGPIA